MSDSDYKNDLDYIEEDEIRIKRMDNQSKMIIYENICLSQKEIENFVSRIFSNLNIKGIYSPSQILTNISYIEDESSHNFENMIEEMQNYDFSTQLIDCYYNIEEKEITLKCLSALSIFLLNAPQQINSNVYEFTFQNIFRKAEESEFDDEFILFLNLLTNIVNIDTILNFTCEDCSHLFSIISEIDENSILSSFLSFVFKFYSILNEHKKKEELSDEILIDFTKLYVNFIKSNPNYLLKQEKAIIIQNICEKFNNNEDILNIVNETIPFLISMGSDIYFHLYNILMHFPITSECISLCSSSLFDSILSCYPENAFLPGISLMDKILSSDPDYFYQIFINEDPTKFKMLAASLVQQILKSDAKKLIFSGRMLCLLIIHYSSQFLEISPWISNEDDNDLDQYNLSQSLKRIFEYGLDISVLASASIESLFHQIQIESPDSIESFRETMNNNGIVHAIENQLDLCEDEEDKEILESTLILLNDEN